MDPRQQGLRQQSRTPRHQATRRRRFDPQHRERQMQHPVDKAFYALRNRAELVLKGKKNRERSSADACLHPPPDRVCPTPYCGPNTPHPHKMSATRAIAFIKRLRWLWAGSWLDRLSTDSADRGDARLPTEAAAVSKRPCIIFPPGQAGGDSDVEATPIVQPGRRWESVRRRKPERHPTMPLCRQLL
jgi:hypothetical protein